MGAGTRERGTVSILLCGMAKEGLDESTSRGPEGKGLRDLPRKPSSAREEGLRSYFYGDHISHISLQHVISFESMHYFCVIGL